MAHSITSMNRKRFAKLSIISIDVYAKLLQCVADKNVRADISFNIIQSNPTLRKSLTYDEKRVLQSLATDGYSNCDTVLMYKIIRHILPPPGLGWGIPPGMTDLSVSDDVERIRLLRNKVVHRTIAEATQQEEQDITTHSLTIAKRMDTYLNRSQDDKFESWIIKILRSSIDPDLEEKYVERGLKIEELKSKLTFIEGNMNLQLISGKKLKLFLGNELWEKDDKPDEVQLIAEIKGLENDNREIVEYLNAHDEEINEGANIIIFKKAKLGSIVLFLELRELVPEEEFDQQIERFLVKLFQRLVLKIKTPEGSNLDIMVFPDEFLIEDKSSSAQAKIPIKELLPSTACACSETTGI